MGTKRTSPILAAAVSAALGAALLLATPARADETVDCQAFAAALPRSVLQDPRMIVATNMRAMVGLQMRDQPHLARTNAEVAELIERFRAQCARPEWRGHALVFSGWMALAANDPATAERALAEAERAPKNNPHDTLVEDLKVSLLLRKGDEKGALAAAPPRETLFSLYLDLYRDLLSERRTADALKALDKAVSLQRTTRNDPQELVELLTRRGGDRLYLLDLAGAEADAAEAVRLLNGPPLTDRRAAEPREMLMLPALALQARVAAKKGDKAGAVRAAKDLADFIGTMTFAPPGSGAGGQIMIRRLMRPAGFEVLFAPVTQTRDALIAVEAWPEALDLHKALERMLPDGVSDSQHERTILRARLERKTGDLKAARRSLNSETATPNPESLFWLDAMAESAELALAESDPARACRDARAALAPIEAVPPADLVESVRVLGATLSGVIRRCAAG